MSDYRSMRVARKNRGLIWTAAACITASLLTMIAISIAGPSISVPAMAHDGGAPPWWLSLGLHNRLVLFTLWAAAIAGAVGVGAGLLAVARGARPPVRPLLAVSFIVVTAFIVLPPAGTTDTQSYAIDGNMVVLGHSPYVDTPKQMAQMGDVLALNSPVTWQNSLSDYGPLATAEEWVSAEIGGSSLALITFWLKLWVAAAFGAVVLLLDRLLRYDPRKRLRAHLLWSLNPLVIWEIVASGHIDGLAVAFGLAGLVTLRRKAARSPGLAVSLAAGVLIGAATAIKSPFALYGLGAAWALRRSPAAIASLTAGWLAVVIPSYAIAGRPAVTVLFQRGSQVTWDNLYQVFYRPFGVEKFGSDQTPQHLATIAMVLFIAVAVLALLRMPDMVPRLPALTPALALSLAWIFFWPYQRPWYDVMIIAPLALYAASWLDGVVLARLCFAAVTYMEAGLVSHRVWLQHVQLFEGEWITSTVRMLSAAALVWMCVSGRWGIQPADSSADVSPPVLQPQTLLSPTLWTTLCAPPVQNSVDNEPAGAYMSGLCTRPKVSLSSGAHRGNEAGSTAPGRQARMNLYDGSDGNDVRPDEDFGTDMITMNPRRWQRWHLGRPGRPIAVAGVAVVALAAGGGVGYAATHSVAKPAADTAAVSATPSPKPSAVAPAPVHRFGKGFRVFGGGPFGGFGFGPFGGGVIHGQFTAPKSGGGYQTLDMQRGTVTAVSGTSISVKSADGFSASYTVTSKTLVDAQAAGIGSVKKGDSVVVIATVSGSTATAADVMDLNAIKSGRASFGFRTGPGNPQTQMVPMPAPPAQAPSA